MTVRDFWNFQVHAVGKRTILTYVVMVPVCAAFFFLPYPWPVNIVAGSCMIFLAGMLWGFRFAEWDNRVLETKRE